MSRRRRGNGGFKVFLISLLIALLLAVAALLMYLIFNSSALQRGKDDLSKEVEVSSIVEEVAGNDSSEIKGSGIEEVTEEIAKPRAKDNLKKFDKELEEAVTKNGDTKAWLDVPGTNISEPVPQNLTRKSLQGGVDSEYYLRRNLDGKYGISFNFDTVIFADSRNRVTSLVDMNKNTIMYGHNWTNVEANSPTRVTNSEDIMFAQLPSFSNLEFAQKNNYFTLDLANGEKGIYMIFAAMYVDTYNPDNLNGYYYLNTDPSDRELAVIIDEARARSEHLYKVPVGISDKFTTLTTCTNKFGSNKNQRFVVMGRLLRDAEDITDFEKPIKNPMPKRPNV